MRVANGSVVCDGIKVGVRHVNAWFNLLQRCKRFISINGQEIHWLHVFLCLTFTRYQDCQDFNTFMSPSLLQSRFIFLVQRQLCLPNTHLFVKMQGLVYAQSFSGTFGRSIGGVRFKRMTANGWTFCCGFYQPLHCSTELFRAAETIRQQAAKWLATKCVCTT